MILEKGRKEIRVDCPKKPVVSPLSSLILMGHLVYS